MSESSIDIAITDRLGLDQDQRHVRTSLDNATQSIQDLPGACLLSIMQGGLREKVQVQECQAGMHPLYACNGGALRTELTLLRRGF